MQAPIRNFTVSNKNKSRIGMNQQLKKATEESRQVCWYRKPTDLTLLLCGFFELLVTIVLLILSTLFLLGHPVVDAYDAKKVQNLSTLFYNKSLCGPVFSS